MRLLDLTPLCKNDQYTKNMFFYCNNELKLTYFYYNDFSYKILNIIDFDDYYIIKLDNENNENEINNDNYEFKIPKNLTVYKL